LEIILRRAAGPYISLHCVDFVDGRNIPKAVIGGSWIGQVTSPLDDVRT
jgi:hypothetical protein